MELCVITTDDQQTLLQNQPELFQQQALYHEQQPPGINQMLTNGGISQQLPLNEQKQEGLVNEQQPQSHPLPSQLIQPPSTQQQASQLTQSPASSQQQVFQLIQSLLPQQQASQLIESMLPQLQASQLNIQQPQLNQQSIQPLVQPIPQQQSQQVLVQQHSLQAASDTCSQSDVQVTVLQASQNLSSSEPHLTDEDNPDSSPNVTQNQYCVQFEDNNCKRWDGKKVWLDGEWIEELYQPPQLSPGSKIILPWPGRGGHIKQWKATIIDPALASTSPPTTCRRQPKKVQGILLHISAVNICMYLPVQYSII